MSCELGQYGDSDKITEKHDENFVQAEIYTIFATKTQLSLKKSCCCLHIKQICNRSVNPEINDKNMAKPIKETPVLTGEDATRFECASIEFAPASKEEKEEAQKAFEFFSSIATFNM